MTIKRFIGKSWPIKGDGAEFVLQFAEHNITAQFAVHIIAEPGRKLHYITNNVQLW